MLESARKQSASFVHKNNNVPDASLASARITKNNRSAVWSRWRYLYCPKDCHCEVVGREAPNCWRCYNAGRLWWQKSDTENEWIKGIFQEASQWISSDA